MKNANSRIYFWGTTDDFISSFEPKELSSFEEVKNSLASEKINENHLKDIVSVGIGNSHIIILTKKRKVIAIGKNNNYSLGTNNTKAKASYHSENVQKIRCYENLSAIISQGKIYYWGSYQHESDVFVKSPTSVKLPKGIQVVDIAIASRHLVCLSKEEHVYSAGCNLFSELGYESTKTNWKEFKKLDSITDIKKIVCGKFHTAALTKGG